MEVLLFIDSLGGGGAQRQLVNLAIGLKQRQHIVHVCTYFPFDTHLQRLNEAGVHYHCFGKRGRWDLSPAKKLYQQIKQIEPAVVVAFMRTPAFYAELVKLVKPGTPLIVSERCGVEEHGLTIRDYLPALGHMTATHLTANSHDFLNRLTHRVIPLRRKNSVIYNGVSQEFINVGAKQLSVLATRNAELPDRETQDNTTTRFCVVAARTTRQKGLVPLVNAMLALNESDSHQFTVDWIGPIDDKDPQYMEACNLLNDNSIGERWHWHGETDNPSLVYPKFDALLLPSLYEGVANTMCEAMCCALPVIATDIADNKRILENGRSGILCEPDNPESLANAINFFLCMSQTERQQLAAAGYQRGCDLFSMSRFIDQWEQLCQNPRQALQNHA